MQTSKRKATGYYSYLSPQYCLICQIKLINEGIVCEYNMHICAFQSLVNIISKHQFAVQYIQMFH